MVHVRRIAKRRVTVIKFTCMLCMLSVVACAATGVAAQDARRTIARSVLIDRETRVGAHSNGWPSSGGACNPNAAAQITVVTPPANGSVRTEVQMMKDPDCSNPVQGTAILYRPRPGFTGTDSFVVSRRNVTGGTDAWNGIYAYTITVRAPEN